jgi:uncharacterized membrane protein
MKEQHYRSVIKGITWRMIGTLDTIFLSWLFTGDISSALKIGGIEVFTKIMLFYFHERVWLKMKYGRTEVMNDEGILVMQDKHYRSVVKGFSWRFFGTMDTIIIASFITSDFTKAFSIGFTEVFTKVGLYYLHERVWQKIKFGTIPQTEPSKAEVVDINNILIKEVPALQRAN